MKIENNKLIGKGILILLFTSLFLLFGTFQGNIITVQAASGTFDEDFTTTTNMDGSNTNVTGWGTGAIESSKKKPEIVGSISSTFIGNTIDVFVDGDYAFVTNQGEGLKVVNITDPTNPYIIGTYVTDNIAQSVYVDGDYAFIADYEGDPILEENILVLDVSDPTNPIHLGNCSSISVAGDLAWDIVVDGDIAYVANGGGGLCVIDISIPSSPIVIEKRITLGTSYDLLVEGDYVYLADDSNGLVVLDVTDPTSVSIAATYNTGISSAIGVVINGNYAYVVDFNNGIVVVNITDPTTPTYVDSWSKSDVSDAYIYGDYLYVTDITNGLSVVNITDPTIPTLINTISLPGFAQAIVIDGCYAYIASQTGGLQIVQIANPSPPTPIGSYNTPDYACDIVVSGDFAYVAAFDVLVADSSSIQILNISDPSSPTFAGSYDTPDHARGVFVSGDYAYVAAFGSGLLVLDISDPSSPSLAGSYNTPGDALGVFVSGNYAYVADSAGGLQVLDISDPSSPTLIGSYDTPDRAYDVFVSGDYAYVADYDIDDVGGLQVLDISDPSSPTLAGSYDTPETARGVFVSGDYAYIANGYSGLQILDISNPSSPTFTGSYITSPDYTLGVSVSGDYAYVAAGYGGLQVLDISDPSSPTLAGSYDTPGRAWDVLVSGDYAYVADQSSGLQVIEVRKNRARQFASSPCIAQSSVIPTSSGSYSLLNAILTVNDTNPVDTTLTYYLSADNGNNWESITPGTKHDFAYSGSQLKWKAVLTTSNISVTPIIYDFSIDYTTVLDAPSLDTPIDGYITDDYTPTFTWSGINGESNYLFQLDTSTIFTSPLLNLTLPSSSTSYTPSSPLSIDTYYWRVAGIDSEGDLGSFSTYRSIIIIQDTNGPVIDHPSDVPYQLGQTGNTIIWNPTDANPDWYNITLNSFLIDEDVWDGGSISINVDGMPLGTSVFECSVYDLEGLEATDIVNVIVSSTDPPTIDDVANFPYEEGTTGNEITWHPSDTNPDYYSITRDGTVIDDGLWLGGDINIDIDGLTYGVYNYVCFVNDTEGQSNSDTVVITVTDNAMPILNTPSDVIYDEGDTGNNIIWIATDNNPSSYIVYREGVQVDTDSWTSGSSIIISVDGLSAASYNYTIVVFDEAGNSDKDEVTVAVTPAAPEFSQSVFFAIISITVVFVLYYIKRRTHKKS